MFSEPDLLAKTEYFILVPSKLVGEIKYILNFLLKVNTNRTLVSVGVPFWNPPDTKKFHSPIFQSF